MGSEWRPEGHLDQPLPPARKDGLVVTAVEGDVLVYDRQSHRAHSLNQTAAFVWRHCDGQATAQHLAGMPADDGSPLGEDAVWLALRQIGKAGLLQQPVPAVSNGARYSRKAVLRKAGVGLVGGALVLPVVTSIVAPIGAYAQGPGGCVCNNGPCQYVSDCCPNPGGNCMCHAIGTGAKKCDGCGCPAGCAGCTPTSPAVTKLSPAVVPLLATNQSATSTASSITATSTLSSNTTSASSKSSTSSTASTTTAGTSDDLPIPPVQTTESTSTQSSGGRRPAGQVNRVSSAFSSHSRADQIDGLVPLPPDPHAKAGSGNNGSGGSGGNQSGSGGGGTTNP